ncbi:MAG: phosphorylase [Betaproteobacteria bacterium HGW-Betaproteobacteria-21]|nr:MAG: phosphorylase [Betaproteobacteria bacterium HGW-Betaproteobacteria-21]
MTSPPTAKPDLLGLIDQTIASALDTGTLQPIRTEQTLVHDDGSDFSVRWVSSLARKDAARVDAVTRRTPDFNPFLPPEPSLTVAELGAGHLAVLNKYPVIERHLLIITRQFEAQTAPLNVADFSALALVMRTHGGLGFYNGGAIAGASQPHKHLQWVPSDSGLQSFMTSLSPTSGELGENLALPWRHICVRLDEACWVSPAEHCGAQLHAAFARACTALDLPSAADPMPAYNLLLTRDGLMLVPRSREKREDISVNALGFAGSLFVRRPEQIELLRAIGPLALLTSVAQERVATA